MHLPFLSFITATLLFMSFDCTGSSANSSTDPTGQTIKEVAKMIHDEVGSARAETVDHCDIIPIGVKPAGGPWGYLVFSAEISDREYIEKLVEQYNKLDAERNRDNGLMSSADYATEPSLILTNGACKGDGQYAWNPGDILQRENID